jgi:SPP1 family predicted phage head-tail adaptor
VADPTIADLRWRVTIAQRRQAPDSTTGIAETFVNLITVWADVQPIGALTFYAGQQTETPITHKIRIRWINFLDNPYVFLRDTIPTGVIRGPVRTEIFRVRRVKELSGRKRWLEVECELEQVQ